MLRSEDPRLRKVAATTVYGMGAKAQAAAPAVAARSSDPDPSLRLSAAMALDNMGPCGRRGRAGADPGPARLRGRGAAVVGQGLGHIGPAAAPAIPALSRAAKGDPLRPTMEEAIRQIRRGSGTQEPGR